MAAPPSLPRFTAFALTHRAIEGRVVRLGYRLEGDASVAFEERMTLPEGLPGDPRDEAVQRALEGLHLACGTSYWKAAVPGAIRLESPLPAAEAGFWTTTWEHGLGEFFYRNSLSSDLRPRVPGGGSPRPATAPALPCDGPPLLLMGGGKDSAVSLGLLRDAGVEPVLFSLGRAPRIMAAAAAAGGRHLVMERRIAPALLELNAAGALNGHVPISAIISFAARIVALLGGNEAIVASNERSASTGNVVVDGFDVNHQWSKGLAYERLVREWEARNCPAGPVYFSLLRPLSELAIGALLARHPECFDAISSCNRNFALDASADVPRWCGTCPKCVFVFLVVSPWLDDAGVARLFGRAFLEDPATLPVVEELLGIEGLKPFECVGTPDEVSAALWLLHDQGRYASTAAMATFRERVLGAITDPARLVDDVLRPSDDHAIPERWRHVVHAAR